MCKCAIAHEEQRRRAERINGFAEESFSALVLLQFAVKSASKTGPEPVSP